MNEQTDVYEALFEGRGLAFERRAGDTAWCLASAEFPLGVAECTSAGVLRVLGSMGGLTELDLATGEVRRATQLAGLEDVSAAAFDAQGERVAVGVRRSLVGIFDAASGALLVACDRSFDWPDPSEERYDWVGGFSHDGALLLGALVDHERAMSVVHVTLWDAGTGAVVASWPAFAYPVWSGAGDAVFSVEGEQPTLVRRGTDGAVEWSRALEVGWTRPHRGFLAVALVCTADGSRVLIEGANPKPEGKDDPFVLRVYDAARGELAWSRAHRHPPTLRAVPGGALFIAHWDSRAVDARTGTVAPVARELDRALSLPGGIASCIGASGEVLYVVAKGRVDRFDPRSGDEITGELPRVGRIERVALSASGARALTVNTARALRVWERATGATQWTLEGWKPRHGILEAAITADERTVLAVRRDGVMAWSMETGLVAYTVGFEASQERVAEGTGVGLNPVFEAALHDDGEKLFLLGTSPALRGGRELLCYELGAGRVTGRTQFAPEDFANAVIRAVGDEVRLALWTRDRVRIATVSFEQGALVEEVREMRYPPANVPVIPFGRAGGWAVDGGRLVGTQDGPSASYASAYDDALVAYPVVLRGDARCIVTGATNGDALVWRAWPPMRGGVPRAECIGRVRLSQVGDALASAAFDARGETLVFGTARGALLFCTLAP